MEAAAKIRKRSARSKKTTGPFFSSAKKPAVSLKKPSGPSRIEKPAAKPAKPIAGKEAPAKKTTEIKKLAPTFHRISASAKKFRAHKRSEDIVTESQNAARLPARESNTALANKSQVEIMNAQEKKPFGKENFQQKLTKSIQDSIKSKSDAEKIKDEGVSPKFRNEVSASLSNEKAAASGSMEAAAAQAPQTPKDELTTKEPVPIPQPTAQPKELLPARAPLAPDKRPSEDTNMEQEADSLDQVMAQNKVSNEQLERSNEPAFQSAVKDKKQAQTKARNFPKEFRPFEAQQIRKVEKESGGNAFVLLGLMHGSHAGAAAKSFDDQNKRKQEEAARRKEVADKFNSIYANTRKKVDDCFASIDFYVDKIFNRELIQLSDKFSERVASLLDENTGLIDVSVKYFSDEVILDETQIFNTAKEEFIRDAEVPIKNVSDVIEVRLNTAALEIANGKNEQEQYWASLDEKVKKIAADLKGSADNQFAELEQSVKDKEAELITGITEKFNEALGGLNERFEKAKEENKSWLDKAADAIKGVINTIIELKNAIQKMAEKAARYAERIIDDPGAFFGNLADGVGKGFDNFKKNIEQHLIKGVLTWLTGSMEGMGIHLPKELNFEGIISLVLQLLGIGMQKIKDVVIAIIGRKRFEFLEKGVDAGLAAGNKILNIFKILSEKGIGGLWEFIVEEVGKLKDTLIDTVKGFIIDAIATKALTLLMSLLIPGAGFIRAVQLLIRFVVTLFQNAARIVKIIDGIIDTFGEVLNKNLSRVATMVENVLSGFITLAISFLAAVLGLDGLASKVQKFVQEKIRPRVDKLLGLIAQKLKAVLEKIGLDKLIDKSMVAVKKGKAGAEEKKEQAISAAKAAGGKILSFLGLKKQFKANDGKTHSLFFEGTEEKAILMVASRPKTFTAFINSIGEEGSKAKSDAKANAKAEFELLRTVISRKNTGSNGTIEYQENQGKKYEKVTGHVNNLSNHMMPLFSLEGLGKFELIFGSLKDGFGQKMEIKNLHKSTKPPIGSAPGVTNENYNKLKKRRNGDSTYYILGHLLNHNLGGSGNDFRNLTPLSRKANKDHNTLIEETAKSDLNEGKIIDYSVEALYDPGQEIPKPDNNNYNDIVEIEKKTPYEVRYEFTSWQKEESKPQSPTKKGSFPNRKDDVPGSYDPQK
jgi:hypothetical protein